MSNHQLSLWADDSKQPLKDFRFPSTRYQGSKRKLVSWIWDNVQHLNFASVLDVFGGTGTVSYLFKQASKKVIYNDLLRFNWNIGFALIQNTDATLSSHDLQVILDTSASLNYPDFISRTFSGIYYTDDENAWLDRVTYNIANFINDPYKKAIARFALFQACIVKRPYNLFHRANLYMRTADVERGFGNKTTWDTPFETHFRGFVEEANEAIFDNDMQNLALNVDAFDTPLGLDLIYLDPPYLNRNGVGVDYRDFYHFLEGIMIYDRWHESVDYKSRHRRLKPIPSLWNKPNTILEAFDTVINRHRNSTIVISYRDDGIPSLTQLCDLLRIYKKNIKEIRHSQKYALAKSNSHEVLLIAE